MIKYRLFFRFNSKTPNKSDCITRLENTTVVLFCLVQNLVVSWFFEYLNPDKFHCWQKTLHPGVVRLRLLSKYLLCHIRSNSTNKGDFGLCQNLHLGSFQKMGNDSHQHFLAEVFFLGTFQQLKGFEVE